jgi:uncharacterized membrane protein
MKVIIEYIICFFVCAFLGWLIEQSISNYEYCSDILLKKIKLCLPITLIYGLGGIILLFIKRNLILDNILKFSLVSGIMLTIIECIGGKLSKILTEKRLWNYKKHFMNFCDGYCSLQIFLSWIFLSGIFFKSHNYISTFYRIE